jgi:hypothetical protein
MFEERLFLHPLSGRSLREPMFEERPFLLKPETCAICDESPNVAYNNEVRQAIIVSSLPQKKGKHVVNSSLKSLDGIFLPGFAHRAATDTLSLKITNMLECSKFDQSHLKDLSSSKILDLHSKRPNLIIGMVGVAKSRAALPPPG